MEYSLEFDERDEEAGFGVWRSLSGRALFSRLSASFTLALKVNSVLFLFEKGEGLDEAEEQ